MVIPYIVALTHELIPFFAAVTAWPALYFGLRAIKVGGEKRLQGFASTALGLSITGLTLWYINTVGRQDNPLSHWFGVAIPSTVADNAGIVRSGTTALSLITLNAWIAVSAWRKGYRHRAIFAVVVAFLGTLIFLNAIYNELFL